MKRFLTLCLCMLALAAAGCADPTRDQPKATVAEPESEPAPIENAVRYAIATGESSVGFVGSKVTGSHEGGFREFTGEILVANGDPLQSSVRMTIAIDSMWTDTDKLTEHLKSPDFFDAPTYPTASFTSTQVTRDGERYRLVGNLTMHGVTKSISIPADITVEEDRVTAATQFGIQRFDFDIKYPGKPDDLIRDGVLIRLDLVALPAES